MLVTRIGTAPSLASEESWSLSFRKAASIAGVAENGFFLWDKKVFDTRPSSKSVIESDRVEGTAVYDPHDNHIGTISGDDTLSGGLGSDSIRLGNARQPIWQVFEFHSVSSAVEAAGVRQIASASDSRSAPL
jgi:hypothetical protein